MIIAKIILIFAAGCLTYFFFLLVVFQCSKIVGYGFKLGTKQYDEEQNRRDRNEDQTST